MGNNYNIEKNTEIYHIEKIAENLGLSKKDIYLHGNYIAKIPLESIKNIKKEKKGNLILVTAMTPTPSGEGKTTTTIGLADALSKLGEKTSLCIREPSLGPYFGIKGGGTGSGYAQVIPSEDINLHFTGDMYAVSKANNLLSAMIDNHLQHGNNLSIDPRRIEWKRVVDLNDRALREIFVGLGGVNNGIPRKDGFDITPASEVMAILCLSSDFTDLIRRLRQIIIGYTYKGEPITSHMVKADDAMAVLLRDAVHPNIAQTLEHTPAFIHGGAFANIAHGCNSILATKAALSLSDYVVTEAGFGSDLGAEKFFHIKCRIGNLSPKVVVLIATLQSINYHGGFTMNGGLGNLFRHINNIRQFGMPLVVAINRFENDTEADLNRIIKECDKIGVKAVISDVHDKGSEGGLELAKAVKDEIKNNNSQIKFLYPLECSIKDKIWTIACEVYGANGVDYDREAELGIKMIEDLGYKNLPICVAKTPKSFSDNQSLRGAPESFRITVNKVRLAAGAEFIVVICGNILTMPGLPKEPAAEKIKVDSKGGLIWLA